MCSLLFLANDVRGFAHDDPARGQNVAVHLCREIFGEQDEGREAMKDSGSDIESKDQAVRLSDGRLWMLERGQVRAEAGFADDVQGRAIEPFQDFEGFGFSVFGLHISSPQVRKQQGFAPKYGSECLDRLNREAWSGGFALVFGRIPLSQQDALSKHPDHPLSSSIRFGVIVGISHAHMRQRIVVRY